MTALRMANGAFNAYDLFDRDAPYIAFVDDSLTSLTTADMFQRILARRTESLRHALSNHKGFATPVSFI